MRIEENVKTSNTPEVIHIPENQKDSKSQLSNEMLHVYKEKLNLKKDELLIQRQLLEVQRAILSELQKIGNTVHTFGCLE